MSDQTPRGRKRIAGRRPTRPITSHPDASPDPEAEQPEVEETSEETLEDQPPPPPMPAGAAGSSRAPVLVAVLAALVVVTLVAGGIVGEKAWSSHQRERARAAATGAASKAATLVLSYDYRQLSKDFGAARQTLTPDFASKFDETTKVVGEQATKTKATVKAEVREVSVSSSSADVVNVLLFVNQTTTSTVTQGKPRVDLNRARFTMVRSNGIWLVSEVAGL